jgi:hypothetical protein
MQVGIDEAWQDDSTSAVDQPGGAAQRQHLGGGAHRDDAASLQRWPQPEAVWGPWLAPWHGRGSRLAAGTPCGVTSDACSPPSPPSMERAREEDEEAAYAC